MRLIPTSVTQRMVDPNDPTGGMTLDALMARQKALSQAAPEAPRQIASPWQGAAFMANSFVNSLQQKQAQEQEAAGRQQLAQTMSGINYDTGATPEQIATISGLDPDMSQRMIADAITARRQAQQQAREEALTREGWGVQDARQQAAFQHADASQQATFQHADAAAAAAAERAAATPKSTVGQIQADFDKGAYGDPTTPEAQQLRDDAIRKANTVATPAGAASDRKALWAQQDEYINTAATLGQLNRASQLLKEGINTGYLAGAKTFTGATGMRGDEAEKFASRTKEYNSIMNQEAILAMSAILKGATSNTEMAEFIKNMNDQTLDPTVKATMIDRMVAKAQAYQELQGGRIKELGGNIPEPKLAPPQDQTQTILQEARDAIAKGADAGLVRKRLVDQNIDPGQL